MVVLNLTDCPIGLRGDLTRWLMEISPGVFVGQINTRVRDAIWQRVQKNCKNGRATLVYSSNGEQRLSFRVHGDVWEPIDFDGLKLMLRPSSSRLATKQMPTQGFSDAAKRRKSHRYTAKTQYPTDYVVIDIETTGLDADRNDIIEIGAIKVSAGKIKESFHRLINIGKPLPPDISKLTGISDEMLQAGGIPPKEAFVALVDFIKTLPLVAHNASFDMKYLLRACKKHSIPLFTNRSIDTLTLAQRTILNLPNHRLETLCAHFEIDQNGAHRGLKDCQSTQKIYEELIKIATTPTEEVP